MEGAVNRRPWRAWLFGLLLTTLASVATASGGATVDSARMERAMVADFGEAGLFMLQRWLDFVESARSLSEQEQLTAVNDFFNTYIEWVEDIVLWGEEDYWSTPMETLGMAAGDCEDYSIAKYMTLRLLGVPNERLRLIYVNAQYRGASVAHMVLGYYPSPTAVPQILDNINPTIVPANQRTDLRPVFSFNDRGLWVGNSAAPAAEPTARLSRWGDVLQRMQQEGFQF
ncbi:transglutaminase-like cysteine peptidase [Salinispirillum sp. LH 10-3-1]|uniref:Transglutaminase-like cysteine peptidase n=1 Tax=Salinispirillum sp. LH 10-3-1 TaxID=2952525 RepID=A0AB38YHQ6_9GAMM